MESRWLHYTNKYNRIQNSGTFCNDPCIIRQPAKHSIQLQILLIREKNTTCLSVRQTTSRKCIFGLLIWSQKKKNKKKIPGSVGWGHFQTKKRGQMFLTSGAQLQYYCHTWLSQHFFCVKIRSVKAEWESDLCGHARDRKSLLNWDSRESYSIRASFGASAAPVESAGIISLTRNLC